MSRDLVVARSDWATALAQSARNLGSNVDLAYAYASAEGPLFSAFLRRGMRIPDDRCLYNSGRRDLAHVFRPGGSVRCGNVPGTAVFFRGPDVRSGRIRLDERFGPYGAEDVDLCWRLAGCSPRPPTGEGRRRGVRAGWRSGGRRAPSSRRAGRARHGIVGGGRAPRSPDHRPRGPSRRSAEAARSARRPHRPEVGGLSRSDAAPHPAHTSSTILTKAMAQAATP